MNYQEVISYIENIPKFEIVKPLEHAKEMLRRVGNPQNSFKAIHVAGTNGKGSVCAYLDAMFCEGGFKCGLFTSPHLIKINERFKINGATISDDEFVGVFVKIKVVIDDLVKEGWEHPSYFEIICVIGMLYFAKQEVDIAIIETGLGGRLDATNAIDRPLACVITAMGLDHTEYLGDTLAKIAAEKAGIIKPQVPVIYEKTNDEVASVIEAQAKEVGTSTYQLNGSMYEITQKLPASIDFSLHYQYYKHSILSIEGVARYQVANAALALMTMAVLQDFHHLSLEVLCRGLRKARWQGRMEQVLPGVILDGAHNQAGIMEFVKTVAEIGSEHEITILFTTVSDKNYAQMIHLISGKLSRATIITTQISGNRVVSAEHLAQCFTAEGCQDVYSNADVTKAFEQAMEQKGDGLLFCVGSLYMIGEIQKIVSG